MANEAQLNIDSLANLVALSADLQPRVWNTTVMQTAESEDIYTAMQGKPGSGKAFIEDRSLTAKAGAEVIMSVIAPLNGPGLRGNAYRPGNEEKRKANTFSCKIDYIWNGVATDKQAKNNLIIFSDFDRQTQADLGGWLGRFKMNDMKMKLILTANPTRNSAASQRNIFRPSNKGSREALRSGDTVSVDAIVVASELAKTNGAKAASTVQAGPGNQLKKFICQTTSAAMTSVKRDSRYRNAIEQAGNKDNTGNPSFSGKFVNVDGNAIFEHEIVDQDGWGPIGSPQTPKASLGTAIVAGTSALVITGGGNAAGAAISPAPLYFGWFSDYAYLFNSFDASVATDSSTTRYALIYNWTGADAGKFMFVSWNANNGNQLTVVARLSAGSTGTQATTVGNVTWGSSTWTDASGTTLLCETAAEGSTIVETNSYGVPIGFSFIFGEAAAIRCWGRDDMNRVTENRNYGFAMGIGVECEYGQTAALRTDGIAPNYILIEHAQSYAGVPLPNIAG